MEPWFGAGLRTSMAVQVEEIVHGTVGRRGKCYYDEEGKDVRLSVPGVKWADLRRIRRDILESLRSNCQEAFDKIYEQIVDNRRVSMNQHVLPTIKTPGVFNKTKSCTHPPQTNSSPQPNPLTPPPPLSPLPNTPLSDVFTPRSVTHMNSDRLENTTKHARAAVSVDSDECDKENVAITNTTDGTMSPLRKTKPRNTKLDELVCEEIGTGTGRVTRSSARGRLPKSPLVALQATSKRSTRSRTRGARNAKAKASHASDTQMANGDEIDAGHLQERAADVIKKTVRGKCQKEQVVEAEVKESDTKASNVSPKCSTTRRSSRNQPHTNTIPPSHKSPPPLHSRRSHLCSTSPATTSTHQPPPSAPVVTEQKSPPATISTEPSDMECDIAPPTKRTTTMKKLILNVQKSPPLCVTPVGYHPMTNTTSSSCTATPPLQMCVTPVTTPPSGTTPTSTYPPTKWYTAATTLNQSSPSSNTTTAANTTHLHHVPVSSFDGYHTPEWSVPPEKQASPAQHVTETKCVDSKTGSDSGICSNGEWRERRCGSSLGGKRLRSVSLEKLSLNGLETKKLSLRLSSADTPESGVGGEGDGGVSVVTPPDGQDPEILNNKENVVSGDSEDSSSPCGSGSSDDCTASTESQDDMETSPTVMSEPSSGGSDKSTYGSSSGEEVANSPTLLHHQTQPVQGSVVGSGSCIRKSPVVSLKKTKASPWAFLSHRTHFHDVPVKPALLPIEGRPATFLSPKASPRRLEGMGKTLNGIPQLPHSFMSKASPQQIQKAERKAARQHKLMEHLQRKREEEEQRKRELEDKRLQEVERRKRRNAERTQRVAENRRMEEEKRLMQRKKAQEQENEELLKKQKQLKEDERKERSKRHNDRVAAVRARKRQEEEQKAKKLQQIEEDRKMAEELHKQRLEKEEDERQARRAEKMKQERERQQLREAEERERLAKEAADKPEPDVVVQPKNKPKAQPGDKKNAFQQLLASTCTVNMPVNTGRFITEWKNKAPLGTTTVTKSHPTLPNNVHNVSLEKCPPPVPCDSTKEICAQTSSEMNTTFTVNVSSTAEVTTKDVLVTPNKSTTSATCDSYKMTPAEPRSSNYDIDDLSSGDSTDEEDHPKKPIPSWAITTQLKSYMISQEEGVDACTVDPSAIFPSAELLRDVDLSRIFRMKRKRFYHRTSSARWDSPVLLKKGKIDGFSVRLV